MLDCTVKLIAASAKGASGYVSPKLSVTLKVILLLNVAEVIPVIAPDEDKEYPLGSEPEAILHVNGVLYPVAAH